MNIGIFDQPTTDEPTTDQVEPIALEPVNAAPETEISEAETSTEVEDTEATPKTFTAKIGDREVEYQINGDLEGLDLDEIRLGHLRERDYTRKRQEDSAKAKELEAKQAEASELANRLRGELMFEKSKLDSDEFKQLKLEAEDEYNRAVVRFNERAEAFNAWQAEQNKAMQAQQEKLQAENHQSILDAFPQWRSDDQAMKADVQVMVDYLKDRKVNDEVMGKFYDADILPLVEKSMKYDALMSKQLASKKDNKPPQSTQPSSSSANAKTEDIPIEDLFYPKK